MAVLERVADTFLSQLSINQSISLFVQRTGKRPVGHWQWLKVHKTY